MIELAPLQAPTQQQLAPARPFLRWAGGKGRLLPTLMKYVPASFDRYFEPFLGGGALFFALANAGKLRNGASLSDTNRQLVETYQTVRDAARRFSSSQMGGFLRLPNGTLYLPSPFSLQSPL